MTTRICTCEEPRSNENKPGTCARCLLPFTLPEAKGKHVHCWHPTHHNPRWGSRKSGVDLCKCCRCDEDKDIAWRTKLVTGHGPHWRVKVKVYDE